MSLDAPKPENLSTDGLSIGIVCARYNEELTDALLARVTEVIQAAGEPESPAATQNNQGQEQMAIDMTRDMLIFCRLFI